MWGEDESERLYPAPRNAISAPGRDRRGTNGRDKLVLARLVWPSGPIVVPARLLWVDGAAAWVEWEKGEVVRRSWIPTRDVGKWMRV